VRNGVSDLLKMIVFLAEESSKEARLRAQSRGLNVKGTAVTLATIEQQEWDAFKAKLWRRQRLLRDSKAERELGDEDDVDEDDVDMLLSMIDALERARDAPRKQSLTLSEIVRAMQADKVLSLEFQAQARAQASRLLQQLRVMNRVWADEQGRWALL
jgi:hypothetical protein